MDRAQSPSVHDLAQVCDLSPDEVRKSLEALENSHLLVRTTDRESVRMLHPFSGVPTGYRSIVGDAEWHANCAWDALAILSIMGDGTAVGAGQSEVIQWEVAHGLVSPDGVIHLRVPARQFWDDIVFT